MISSTYSRKLTVLYGSQTGTAQAVAEHIGREAKRRHFRAYISPLDAVPVSRLLSDDLVLFVCSTTGQGDPADNMTNFWKFLLRKSLPKDSLLHLNYGVVGLGDSSYQKFNVVGKILHKRLIQLGATSLLAPAFGDEQHDVGHDAVVDPWLDKLWLILLQRYPLPAGVEIISADLLPPPRYKIHFVSGPNAEISKMGKIETQNSESQSFSCDNPFQATLISNSRITASDHFQDVRLVRVDLTGSRLQYNPGDVLMVQPRNINESTQEFIALFDLNPDQYVTLESTDADFTIPKIPQPCSIRYLVENYFDIDRIPLRFFFKLLSFFAKTSELEQERLQELASSDGQQDLFDYCNRPRRTTLEILQEFPHATSHVTLDYLFDLIPKLQPRAFSIASSQNAYQNEAQLLMAVVKYKSKLFKPRRGVCSTWLSEADPDTTSIPVWIKRGTISFPSDNRHVIMVGPGTGLAPFRSFIQYRAKLGIGNMMLFFGCRNEANDFFCKDELEALVSDKSLILFTAFSRDQEEKIYVQHRIREQSKLLWQLIHEQNASIYIAGNSKNMPDAVKESFEFVIETEGGVSAEDAKCYITKLEKTTRYQIEAWS